MVIKSSRDLNQGQAMAADTLLTPVSAVIGVEAHPVAVSVGSFDASAAAIPLSGLSPDGPTIPITGQVDTLSQTKPVCGFYNETAQVWSTSGVDDALEVCLCLLPS